jgi:hypothetical protein
MNMRIFLGVVCVGAAAFMLFVLAALVSELRFSADPPHKAHRVTFRPSQNRAELFEMRFDIGTRRIQTGNGQRVAVFLLACLGVAKTAASAFGALIKF